MFMAFLSFSGKIEYIACAKFLIACYGNGVLVHENVEFLLYAWWKLILFDGSLYVAPNDKMMSMLSCMSHVVGGFLLPF